MIAGDDRAHFLAGGAGAGGFLGAAGGRDDELIGGEHQLGAERILSGRPGDRNQPAAALGFGLRRVLRRQRMDDSHGSVDATSVTSRSLRRSARK